MTDYAVEFYVDPRFPSGAKQWLADQKIFHHAESLRITGGDEVSAVTYRVRFDRPQDALAFQQRYCDIFAAWG